LSVRTKHTKLIMCFFKDFNNSVVILQRLGLL